MGHTIGLTYTIWPGDNSGTITTSGSNVAQSLSLMYLDSVLGEIAYRAIFGVSREFQNLHSYS